MLLQITVLTTDLGFLGVLRVFQFLVVLCVSTLLASCVSPRSEFSQTQAESATVPGYVNIRVWSDEPRARYDGLWSRKAASASKPLNVLSLSGGGAEGAFGAGFLKGWSEAGTRPEFSVVSGASSGAFVALFAFLGPDYDEQLESMFTQELTSRLVRIAGLNALFGTAVFSSKPLERMVDKYVDEAIMMAVANEHSKGRRLFVTTTNIDSQRTAIWDMGAIAASNNENALELFRTVLLASAAVPGLLPPRLIEVESNGYSFEEMHVDGGVTANIMLLPEALLLSGQKAYSAQRPTFYLLMNGRSGREFRVVKPHTIEILERSFGASIKAKSISALMASSTYMKKHGWRLKTAALDPSYPILKHEAQLNEDELRALFAEGVKTGRMRNAWTFGIQ